jgi:hypothetical protein
MAWLIGLSVVLLVPGLWCLFAIMSSRDAAKREQVATEIGAVIEDPEPHFLNQFPSPPWISYERAKPGTFRASRLFCGAGHSPQFWVFDLTYEDDVIDLNEEYRPKHVYHVCFTFIVVKLNFSPSVRLQLPPVPAGFTAIASKGYLYFYRSTAWFKVGSRLSPNAIPAALDQARSIAANVTPATEQSEPILESVTPRGVLEKLGPELLLFGWGIVVGAALIEIRDFPFLLLLMPTILCAAVGQVWRRNSSRIWLFVPFLFAWTLALSLHFTGTPIPWPVYELVGIGGGLATLLVALYGIRRVAMGRYVGLLFCVACIVYAVKQDQERSMFYGIVVALAMIAGENIFLTSKYTRRDAAGKLLWKDQDD